MLKTYVTTVQYVGKRSYEISKFLQLTLIKSIVNISFKNQCLG